MKSVQAPGNKRLIGGSSSKNVAYPAGTPADRGKKTGAFGERLNVILYVNIVARVCDLPKRFVKADRNVAISYGKKRIPRAARDDRVGDCLNYSQSSLNEGGFKRPSSRRRANRREIDRRDEKICRPGTAWRGPNGGTTWLKESPGMPASGRRCRRSRRGGSRAWIRRGRVLRR